MTQGSEQDRQAFLSDRLELGSALTALIQGLPKPMFESVAGACVYNATDSDHIVVISNAHGPRSDRAHKAFLSKRILHAHIPLSGTSVNEGLRDQGNAGFYASGYRPDQRVFNMQLGAGRNGKPPPVVSVVFDQSTGVPTLAPAEEQELLSAIQNGAQNLGLDKKSMDFEQKWGADLGAMMPLADGRPRDAFLLFCDIVGSTEMAQHLGYPNIQDVLKFTGDNVNAIAENHHGFGLRSYGDDMWLIFPCTDLPDAERARFFEDHVLQAALEMHEWYQSFTSRSSMPVLNKSGLMMSASFGEHIPARAKSRFESISHDGEPFFRVAEMMKMLKRVRGLTTDMLSKTGAPKLLIDETIAETPMLKPKGFQPWSPDLNTINVADTYLYSPENA